jgi:hypothetical protein
MGDEDEYGEDDFETYEDEFEQSEDSKLAPPKQAATIHNSLKQSQHSKQQQFNYPINDKAYGTGVAEAKK